MFDNPSTVPERFDELVLDADCIAFRAAVVHQDTDKDSGQINRHKVSWVYNTIDSLMQGIFNSVPADYFTAYVGGSNNFRYQVAPEVEPYKCKRHEKPVHLKAAVDYMVRKYGAIKAEGQEADDCCAIHVTQSIIAGRNPCLIYEDKDLNMVIGWKWLFHKDRRRRHFTYVNPAQGLKWFYMQLLSGDSTDDIIGIKRVALKTAGKKLANASTNEELWATTWSIYRDHKDYAEFSDDDLLQLLTQRGRLLWMRTCNGEMWQPPSL